MARVLDEDELIEHWTLVGDELDLLTGRTGPSRLGLALWLKFFIMKGCFPAGRSELPDEAVGWVASQVKVPASDLGLFDWEGRTAERARKTVRTFLGCREAHQVAGRRSLQPGAPCPAGPRGTAGEAARGADRAAQQDPARPDDRVGAEAVGGDADRESEQPPARRGHGPDVVDDRSRRR